MYAVLCFVASAAAMIAAAGCFRANQTYRGAIDEALGGAINIPERTVPFYDAAYLNKFISIAASRPTAFDKSALEIYIRPTLLWIDVGFAIFCAAFAALFWFGLLNLLPGYRVLDIAFRFFLVMAVLYGLSDVAEDLWLARLFSKGREVTGLEGAIACGLTQTKILTIALSLVGGLFFLVLGRVFASSRLR